MKPLKTLSICFSFFLLNCTTSPQEAIEEKELEKVDSLIKNSQRKSDSAEAYWKKKIEESKSEE